MPDLKIAYILREIPLFADLKPKEIALLGMVMREIRAEAGEDICREGEPGSSCFFVVRGAVDVIKRVTSTEEKVVATLGSHQVFGQIALVDDGPRSATCRARVATELLRLEKSDFEMLFESGSQFALRFQALIARSASQQLREANRRLTAILLQNRGHMLREGSEELAELRSLMAQSDVLAG